MSRFDQIGEFNPTSTYALDTTSSTLGAPAPNGAIVFRPHPSGIKYGLQGFRLALNESGGALTAGLGYTLSAADATGVGVSVKAAWGAALTKPLNLLAGVAQAAVADDYWGWFQVYGAANTELRADEALDAGDLMETAAGGEVADTTGTGVIIGFNYSAESDEDTDVDSFLLIVSPR